MINKLKPQATGHSKESVERFAEQIATLLHYSPGSSLDDVVSNLGGEVGYVDFWDVNSAGGALIVDDKGRMKVNIPQHTSSVRDNFTIAHELGHYFLHFLPVRDNLKSGQVFEANRYGSDRVEWEANWFASAFLMPEHEFKKSYSSHKGNIFAVADHFSVSPRAAEIRAKRLQLD